MAAPTSRPSNRPGNALGRGSVRAPSGARTAVRRSLIAERFAEGVGVLLVVGAAYLLLALVTFAPTDPSFSYAGPGGAVLNWGGRVGAYLSDVLLTTFGLGAFVWVGWLCFHAYNLLSHREDSPSFSLQIVTLPMMLLSLGVLLYVFDPLPSWPNMQRGFEMMAEPDAAALGIGSGGLLGKLMASMVLPLLGKVGGTMLMAAVLALSILWFTGWTLADVRATCVWLYKMGRITGTQLMRMPSISSRRAVSETEGCSIDEKTRWLPR